MKKVTHSYLNMYKEDYSNPDRYLKTEVYLFLSRIFSNLTVKMNSLCNNWVLDGINVNTSYPCDDVGFIEVHHMGETVNNGEPLSVKIYIKMAWNPSYLYTNDKTLDKYKKPYKYYLGDVELNTNKISHDQFEELLTLTNIIFNYILNDEV